MQGIPGTKQVFITTILYFYSLYMVFHQVLSDIQILGIPVLYTFSHG